MGEKSDDSIRLTKEDIAYILKLISALNRNVAAIREELDTFKVIFQENLTHFIAYLEEIFEKLKKITKEVIALRKTEKEE